MIINKLLVGFVIQKYDTETKRFISQEFVTNTAIRNWEDANSEPIETPHLENGEEPCLTTEMVQPPVETSPQPPPLLPSPYNFNVGEQVEVIPLDVPNPEPANRFIGTVVGIKNGEFVMVKDQDDDVWCCEPIQVHHIEA